MMYTWWRDVIKERFCIVAILFVIFDIEILFELRVKFFYVWYVNILNW